MESGIYSIVCNENGKRYVGQSVNLAKRRTDHFSALENNRHPNKHLQRAYNSGLTFTFEVLEYCAREELNDKEIYWIRALDTFRHGYNQCEGGASTQGRVCAAETRRKISAANKGRRVSAEVVQRRRQSLKNHLESDPLFAESHRRALCARAKHEAWNKGIPCPEERKKVLSLKLKGRLTRTEQHKQHLRELYSGENSLTAKLSRDDVVNIRLRFLNGESQSSIARDYPVTNQTIYDIVRGRRWKSIPMTKKELEDLL